MVWASNQDYPPFKCFPHVILGEGLMKESELARGINVLLGPRMSNFIGGGGESSFLRLPL